jgi:hypothetical protein
MLISPSNYSSWHCVEHATVPWKEDASGVIRETKCGEHDKPLVTWCAAGVTPGTGVAR